MRKERRLSQSGEDVLGFDLEVGEKQQRLSGWAVPSSLGFIFQVMLITRMLLHSRKSLMSHPKNLQQ